VLYTHSWALTPEAAPYCHCISFGWELLDVCVRQEVHHHLVALVYAKQLRGLHVLASAHFLARRISHHLP